MRAHRTRSSGKEPGTRRRRARKRRRPSRVAPNYPDTGTGAIACLSADSRLNLDGAAAFPDPRVDGVWKVVTPNDPSVEFAIVYLAGYREPLGRVRAGDDFECCERS